MTVYNIGEHSWLKDEIKRLKAFISQSRNPSQKSEAVRRLRLAEERVTQLEKEYNHLKK